MRYHGRSMIFSAVLAVCALLLNFIDRNINISLPFIRIGLANIVVLYGIGFLFFRDLFFIVMFKVLVTSLIFGTFGNITFFCSLTGSIGSFLVMYVLYKRNFSVIAVSIAASIVNIFLQIMIVSIYLDVEILFLLRTLYFISIINGTVTGISVYILNKKSGFLKNVFLAE